VATGLDRIVTQPIQDLAVNSCRYGVMLNDHAGVIDDLIVFRLAKERWLIVVNAGTMEKDARHFESHLSPAAKFQNISAQTAKIDVQGPKSRELLARIVPGIERLSYYTFGEFDVLGERVIVSRTGYTGELGYEIYYPGDKMVKVWQEVLALGAKPAGLGARDVLRLEMGYCLYGHELSEDISPLVAGLNSFIDWNKDFLAKNVLQNQKQSGITKKAVCLVSQSRRSPRAGQKIFSGSGQDAGVVTSGSFSPALTRGIGIGIVEAQAAAVGQKISFGEGANLTAAEICKKPFYKNGTFKN
jgi:aminomethyltransferase